MYNYWFSIKIKMILYFLCFFFAFTNIHAQKLNNKPIIIVLNNWSSQIVVSKILGALYKEMGFEVDYRVLSIDEQWGALARGVVHVQVEVWEGTMSKMFHRMIDEGLIVDAGTYPVKTREEWWYPLYVENLCPGLPNWKALKKCSAVFATEKTFPKGRYLAGPWEKPDEARVRSLGLNFEVFKVTKSGDLWAELKKAYEKKEPIILFNWTPNWVEAVYKGKFIEFPEFDEKCKTDPKWGVNKNFLHDCGNPKNGWLKKAAWAKLDKNWPGSLTLLKNMAFDNKMFAEITALAVVNKLTYEQSAEYWMINNYELWQGWLPEIKDKGRND